MTKAEHKVCLVVLDGWGSESGKEGDATKKADTPVMDELRQSSTGATELEASSLAVGLPEGLMGNSEVGHLNIGAGRVVWQDVVRIDETIRKGKLAENETIKQSFQKAKDGNGRLHLLGLVSDGGVHSKLTHLEALLQVAKDMQVPHVFVHFFGDGRDTDPKSGAGHLETLLAKMKELGTGQLATIVGRYYIMDRDKRWERVKVGIDGVVHGEGEDSDDPVALMKKRYEDGQTDEFMKPIIIGGKDRRVQDGDSLFFFNYRSDRVREVTQILGDVDRSPKEYDGYTFPKLASLTTMTQYKLDYPFPIAFKPQHMGNVLAEWLAKQKCSQLHAAETEKYAHVTFFFNGGVEKQFDGEERILVPSPKVATYDLQPKMSVHGVAEKQSEGLAEEKYDFVMSNFAPPDMVGHTGVYDAAVEACTHTDQAIGTVLEQCKKSGYVFLLTADHGNAEEMINEDGKPKTSHTTNKVPFVMANAPEGWSLKQTDGVLGDVAPTVLAIMGLPQPEEMDGHSLLVKS